MDQIRSVWLSEWHGEINDENLFFLLPSSFFLSHDRSDRRGKMGYGDAASRCQPDLFSASASECPFWSILWYCPFSFWTASPYAYPLPGYLEGPSWVEYCGVWHVQATKAFFSLLMPIGVPEGLPVELLGRVQSPLSYVLPRRSREGVWSISFQMFGLSWWFLLSESSFHIHRAVWTAPGSCRAPSWLESWCFCSSKFYRWK